MSACPETRGTLEGPQVPRLRVPTFTCPGESGCPSETRTWTADGPTCPPRCSQDSDAGGVSASASPPTLPQRLDSGRAHTRTLPCGSANCAQSPRPLTL